MVAYLQKDFGQEPKIAADTYKIVRQVINADGDIEDAVLKSIIDKIRHEAGFASEISMDRLVDLAILRAVKAEREKDRAGKPAPINSFRNVTLGVIIASFRM